MAAVRAVRGADPAGGGRHHPPTGPARGARRGAPLRLASYAIHPTVVVLKKWRGLQGLEYKWHTA